MGMRIVLMTLGDANRERLLRDPELVRSAVSRDDEDDDDEAGSVRGTIELAGHEGQILDLDKAWGAIHYLLTGDDRFRDRPDTDHRIVCGEMVLSHGILLTLHDRASHIVPVQVPRQEVLRAARN